MLAAATGALVLAGGCAPGQAWLRAELREQRAEADMLCEADGGVEIIEPIPEMMDVVTVFQNATEYKTVEKRGDPMIGDAVYRLPVPTPASEMARHAASPSVNAYGIAAHYLSTDRIGAVDLLVEGFQYYDNSPHPNTIHNGDLLPDRDLPDGMYRYALGDADDPRCQPFNDMIAAFEEQGRQVGYKPRADFNTALAANGRCVYIEPLGAADAYTPPAYIYHSYSDDLPDQNVRQTVDELIAPDGQVIARLRHYFPGLRRDRCDGVGPNILDHFQYR